MTSLAVLMYSVLTSSLLLLATAYVYTNIEASAYCGPDSCKVTGNYRSIGNKVSSDYSGTTDVWSNDDGSIMATNLKVDSGQAWPRISEGVVVPHALTPGYPISVNKYLSMPGNRYISYNGQWVGRSNGPQPPPAPKGPRYNGAYIWLNDADQFYPDGIIPKWPFNLEINIWNRMVSVDQVPHSYSDYSDSNGNYKVTGGMVDRGDIKFFAFFVVHEDAKKFNALSDMTINVKALLRHLRDKCGLDAQHKIIDIAAAAEGHAGADGKFIATINTLGR